MIDWTISLGNIVTLAGFGIGGIGFVWALKADVKVLSSKLTAIDSSVNAMTTALGSALVTVGRHDERIKSLETGRKKR